MSKIWGAPQLQIINNALVKCGLPLGAAFNDCDWNASYFFEDVRREILRGFAWGFAQKFENLPAAGSASCGFRHGYALPGDFLKLISVHCMNDARSPKARTVKVVGKKIYANVSPCYLRYICDHQNIDEWPADFCDAVACGLAVRIMPLSGQNMQLVPLLEQQYAKSLAMAQANDAFENFERVPRDFNILASRGGMAEHRER